MEKKSNLFEIPSTLEAVDSEGSPLGVEQNVGKSITLTD